MSGLSCSAWMQSLVNLNSGIATGTWGGSAFTHTVSNIENVRGLTQ